MRDSKNILYSKLGIDTDPLEVMRKLGLNVPSQSDISTGIKSIVEGFSRGSDVKEMTTGSEEFSEGNYLSGGAKMLGGLAGMAIPFSGKIRSAGKVMGKELDKGISRFVKDGEVGEDEFLSSGKLLKNYTTKEQNILNSLVDKATAGSKSKNKKINAFIEEGTPVGGRLNLSSKITDAPAGLDKLQTVHSKNFRGGVLGYEPVTTVVAPKGGKVKFNVGQSNRERIASGKDTKHPAASVDGLYTSKFNLLDDPEAIEIGFNPKMHHLFIDLKTGQAVKDADAATMIGDRVYAKGVSYFKQTKSPNPISSSTVKYKEKNMGGQIMPMQYGGGLDDTYLNMSRRRSNAFADPNANTAFASPMSIGGLPTIYRASGGGDFDFGLSADDMAEAYEAAGIDTSGFTESSSGNFDTITGMPTVTASPATATATAPAAKPVEGDSGGDLDAGGFGLGWDEKRGLLGIQRADPFNPDRPFGAHIVGDEVGSFKEPNLGMYDTVKNWFLGRDAPPAQFVADLNYKEYDQAKEEGKEEWEKGGKDPDKFEGWFNKNYELAMAGVRQGSKTPVSFAYDKQGEAVSETFNTALESRMKDLPDKSKEEVSVIVAEELFKNNQYDKKDTGKINWPFFLPGGAIFGLADMLNKSVGSVMIDGMKFSVNSDGTVSPSDAPEQEEDRGLGPFEVPKKDTATGIRGQLTPEEKKVEEKNKFDLLLGRLGKKKKGREKLPYHPDAPLLAKLYSITLEEANEWLGERTSFEDEMSVGIEEQLT